jgi:pimeloyl-ACP methyl ester carboxylesterase
VAVDWPGHGDSPAPDPRWTGTAAGFADVVEDVVDRVRSDGEPVALIGNSVGGFAAARFAARRPADAAALVLVDSGGFVPVTPLTRAFAGAMGRPAVLRGIYPWFARWYMRDGGPFGTEVARLATATARRPGTTELLSALWRSFCTPQADVRGEAGAITAPTLAVWGSRDPVLPTRAGRAAAAAIPGARLTLLDTGHVPFASRPDEFTAAVLPFLRAAIAARRGEDHGR